MSNFSEYVQKLGSPDETERTYAAEDLGYLNIPEAVAPLLERLQNEPSSVVRDMICQALIRIDGDETLIGSIGLLASDDSQIRNFAVDVLRHKGQRSIPFLLKAMREGDRDTRKFVLDTLKGMQATGTEEIYEAALSDEDPNVVITAVENIGKIRTVAFRERIENLVHPDAHPMLLASCVEALASIGNEASLVVIRRCFPELPQLPEFFLAPCLRATAALGGEKEFAEVASLLSGCRAQLCSPILGALITLHERSIYRHCAPPDLSEKLLLALQALIAGSGPPSCRYQAARVLGFWAYRDDISNALVACLSSLEPMVRLGAAEALRSTENPRLEAVLAACEVEESEDSDEEVSEALSR